MARVLVVGPGALGILFAARMADAGHEVTLAARSADQAKRLANGIVAKDHSGGQVKARPRVVTAPEALRVDLVVLATKCQDTPPALAEWLPRTVEAPIVGIQNGLMGDRLKAMAGDRYMACTVSIPASLEEAGVAVQTGPGKLHLGPWPNAGPRDDPDRYKAAAEILCAVADVEASPNMAGVAWTKLLVNSCITSLGALSGQNLGALLADPGARAAFRAIVREGHRAGLAEGIQFEPVQGFRPGLMASSLPGIDLVLRLVGRRFRAQKSSSLQSLERGRRTEVDFLNGAIVAAAARHGLAAPVNARVVELLHAVEEGDRQSGMDLVRELLARPS